MTKFRPGKWAFSNEQINVINEFYPAHGISDPMYRSFFLKYVADEITILRQQNKRLQDENEKLKHTLSTLSSTKEKFNFYERAMLDDDVYKVFTEFYDWVDSRVSSAYK
jgi:hypothetical protein